MVRVQIEITEEKSRELELLMKEVGIKTKKDLINNALTLFEWAVKEIKEGRKIVSLDEKNKKYKEVFMPCLSNIKK